MGLLSHNKKPHNICTQRDHLHFIISYASPEQTRHDRYQKTPEAEGGKYQRIKKVKIVNESKQCMEGGLQEEQCPMPLKCFYHVLLL